MADDQRTPEPVPQPHGDEGEPTRESTSRGRGFGRFTSRFRRERGTAAVEDNPAANEAEHDTPAAADAASGASDPSSELPGLPASAAPPLNGEREPDEEPAAEAEALAETETEIGDSISADADLDTAVDVDSDATSLASDDASIEPPLTETDAPEPETRSGEDDVDAAAPRPLRPIASVTEERPGLPPTIVREPDPETQPGPGPEPEPEPPAAEPEPAEPPGLAFEAPTTVSPPAGEVTVVPLPVDEPEESLSLEPEVDRDEAPARAAPLTRPVRVSAHLAVLTGLATMVILAFLLIEPTPRWLLIVGAAAVVFGLDGTLRQTWREPFSLGQETAPFLFVPALYMMAVPVLIEHNVSGELVLLVGLGAGLGFGALAWAEVASVRPLALEYDQARLIVTANTYLTGFAIFSLTYVFDIGLPAAVIATGIAAAMLAVEVLREGEVDPMETLGLSLVTGVILGEVCWLLYYMPLDTYLAGLALLLAFYFATGLLHSYVVRALNRVVAMEYTGIAAAGVALVVLARAAGLA